MSRLKSPGWQVAAITAVLLAYVIASCVDGMLR